MSLQTRIDEVLFHRLLSGARIQLIGSAVGGLCITLSQLGSARAHWFLLWCAGVYAVIIFRIFCLKYYYRLLASKGFSRALSQHYCATLILSGVVWGALGFLIKDAAPMTVIMVVTSIQAMVMGGVVTMASCIPAFLAFSLPAMLPAVLMFSLGDNLTSVVMAMFSVAFYVLMIGITYRFNQSLRHATRITFENEDLIGSLKEAYQKISVQNQELNHVAHHDALTKLPNRKLLSLRLEQAMALGRLKHKATAVLYLDLDGFKAINDALGHEMGDLALVEVAQRLSQVIRASDTVARVGGDEFVIVLSDIATDTRASVELVAQKCLIAIGREYMLRGHVCHLGTSIGLILCEEGESIAHILSAADKAMYQAKLSGRGQWVWAE